MKKLINTFFRSSRSNPIWNENSLFIDTVFRGCWPLSPLTVWTLTYITSVNNILQQRSGFNILAKLFSDYEGNQIPEEYFPIKPVELFDRGLGEEFYSSEQTFRSADPIAQEYHYLLEKYKEQLSEKEITVLRSIVLSNKLSSVCSNDQEARDLIETISGLSQKVIETSLSRLSDVYNAVIFNPISNRYEIHSNAVSISEFEKYVSDKVRDYKLSHNASEIFYSVANIIERSSDTVNIRESTLKNIETGFSSAHGINSAEWGYERRIVSGYDYLEKMNSVISDLLNTNPVQFYALKGRIIYVVLPSSVPIAEAKGEVSDLFESYKSKIGHVLPVMCLFLHDEEGNVQDAAIELTVLASLSEDEENKFSTLISKKKDEKLGIIASSLQDMLQQRNYVYPIEGVKPLRRMGEDIFENIYPCVIPFEIDGFSTESGNGGSTIASFVKVLASNATSWLDFLNLGTKESNRASSLLVKCWGCFDNKTGVLLQYPKNEIITNLFHQLDNQLESNKELNVYDIFNTLVNPPYGCNSSQSTLLVFIYLAYRSAGLDFKLNDDIVQLFPYAMDKNAFEPKTKAMTKAKWANLKAVVSKRDDAKWYSLLTKWRGEDTYRGLIACKHEAAKLKNEQKISLPSSVLTTYQLCENRSDKAIVQYSKWMEESPAYSVKFNSLCNGEHVKSPLFTLKDYIALYKATIGNGEFKCSNEELVEYEATRDFVIGYITDNYLKWIKEHPASGIISRKNDFDELKKNYDGFANALDAVGLDDEAIEVRDLIKCCGERRTAYYRYTTEYNSIKNSINSLSNLIDEGLYAYSQVEAYRKNIDELLARIEAFPSDLLEKIPGYGFDDLRNKVAVLNELVSKRINDIDSAFEDLLNYDIQSFKDLSILEDMANPIIAFYSGAGKSKSENLEDANQARKEITLLKKAYYDLSDKTSNPAEISEQLEIWKEKLDKEFDGDNIYPDDEILESFYNETLIELRDKSYDWIKKQEQTFRECASLNDYIRLQQSLIALPLYIVDEDRQRVDELQYKLNETISNKRVEYIYELYSQLNEIDKEKFKKMVHN